MTPSSIGTRIQVLSNKSGHHYSIGGVYRVSQIDPDGTLKAVDEFGIEGDFLKWKECQPVALGWDWLRKHLDPRSLDLLSAFDGLQNLQLRENVESKVILSMPNLAEEILEVLPVVEEALALFKEGTPENDDDDEFDLSVFDEP